MSTMNGNPHYERAVDLLNVPALANLTPEEEAATRSEAQVNATLALAFEQRTANLIALHQMAVTAIQNGADNDGISPDDFRRSSDEIEARLGLNGDAS